MGAEVCQIERREEAGTKRLKYDDLIDLSMSLRGNRAKAAVSFSSLMLLITWVRFEACQGLPHRLAISWLHLAAAARSRSSRDLIPAGP